MLLVWPADHTVNSFAGKGIHSFELGFIPMRPFYVVDRSLTL